MNDWGYPIGYTPPYQMSGGTSGSFFPYGITVGNEAKFADGTESVPSITFTSEPTTGIFHSSPGTGDDGVSITVQGADAFDFQTTQNVSRKRMRTEDGTSSLPGYSFTSDSGTGFYIADTNGSLGTSVTGTSILVQDGKTSTFSTPVVVPGGSIPIGLQFSGNQGGLSADASAGVILNHNGTSVLSTRVTDTVISAPLKTITSGTESAPSYTFLADTTTGTYYNGSDSSLGVTVAGTTTTEFQVGVTSFKKRIIVPSTATSTNVDPSIGFTTGGWVGKDKPNANTITIGLGDFNVVPFFTVSALGCGFGIQPQALIARNIFRWSGPAMNSAALDSGTSVTVAYPGGSPTVNHRFFGMNTDFTIGTGFPLTSVGDYDSSNFTPETKTGAYIRCLQLFGWYRLKGTFIVKVGASSPGVKFGAVLTTATGSWDTDSANTAVAGGAQVFASSSTTPLVLNAMMRYENTTYPYFGIMMAGNGDQAFSFECTSYEIEFEYLGPTM